MKQELENLSIKEAKQKLRELKELSELLNQPVQANNDSIWELGKNYFIRTVTHHHTGKLLLVTDKELVLENAAWIADSGRFQQALEKCEFDEVEMFPKGKIVILNRGAMIEAVQIDKLPIEQK